MADTETICLVLEFNCYEDPCPGVESHSSLWLVPYSLSAPRPDFDLDHHKPKSTCIIGPVSTELAQQVNSSLAAALRSLGFTVQEVETADD